VPKDLGNVLPEKLDLLGSGKHVFNYKSLIYMHAALASPWSGDHTVNSAFEGD
jgi:hypothetical protein